MVATISEIYFGICSRSWQHPAMLTRVFSAAIQGVEAIQVEIEVNAGSGDPVIVLVGLPTPRCGRVKIA
jgi:hypothetical protein